jgi:16S rRNA (guanine527-N7)-methyltransferase
MEEKGLFTVLARGGLKPSDKQRRDVRKYHGLLTAWNRRVNLVSRQLAGSVYEELYYDSLVPLVKGLIPARVSCVDIGSGAGIPGLMLSLFRPDLKMTLVESVRKKVLFLKKACQELNAGSVTVIHRRAEELIKDKAAAGPYDIVLFKAFKGIPACITLGGPLLAPGGSIIIYKGAGIGEELNEARSFFSCYLYKIDQYILPESNKRRNLVIVTKNIG